MQSTMQRGRPNYRSGKVVSHVKTPSQQRIEDTNPEKKEEKTADKTDAELSEMTDDDEKTVWNDLIDTQSSQRRIRHRAMSCGNLSLIMTSKDAEEIAISDDEE
ncbi:hypothetical protein HHI36_005622 [Cryptolaemus montrouzieri]|uniref:Uncharacterized protein n=1 Tax=Cryptolaemus montrouzieri TaxID=559131 RepID=A0ABD2NUX6_9CUCU